MLVLLCCSRMLRRLGKGLGGLGVLVSFDFEDSKV